MSLKHRIRLFLRRFGVDVVHFNALQSPDARLQRLLEVHDVDTVIDVGANDGDYAAGLLDTGFKGQILSFEPLADAHAALSVRAASRRNWSVAPSMALGESAGKLEINVAGNSKSSSLLPMLPQHVAAAPHSKFVGSQVVQVSRLDQVQHPALADARRLFLKIDTQGYEVPVLEGAAGLMGRVHGLQVEMSLAPLYEGQVLFGDLYQRIVQRGFSLHGLVPGFTDQASGRLLQVDGIFFKD